MPTVGFKVEQFTKNNIAFTMFDMSGASTHRDLWTAYYGECDAVIYVVDCKDKLRICVAKKELDDMLANPGASPPLRGTRRWARRHARWLALPARACVLTAAAMLAELKDRRIPFLFFANKSDIAGWCAIALVNPGSRREPCAERGLRWCLSLTPFECCASLGLDDIKSKPWHITCAPATYPGRSAVLTLGRCYAATAVG